MASHRFWRLYFPQNADVPLGQINLTTIEMVEEIGKESVSRSGIAYASSEAYNHGAVFAFDNDLTTSWKTSSSGSHWIAYEFPTPRDIVAILLRAASPEEAPREFLIQWSDNAINWTTSNHYSLAPSSYELTLYYAQPYKGGPGFRFWRVRSLGTSSGDTTLSGLGFRVSGHDLSVHRPISSTTVTGQPSNVFDQDTTTYWTGQGAGAWIGAEFGENVDIREVQITAPNTSTLLANFPRALAVDAAWEYGTWLNIGHFEFVPFSAGETRTITIVNPWSSDAIYANKVSAQTIVDAVPASSVAVLSINGATVLNELRYGLLKTVGHAVVREGRYEIAKLVGHVVLGEPPSPGMSLRNVSVRNSIMRGGTLLR